MTKHEVHGTTAASVWARTREAGRWQVTGRSDWTRGAGVGLAPHQGENRATWLDQPIHLRTVLTAPANRRAC